MPLETTVKFFAIIPKSFTGVEIFRDIQPRLLCLKVRLNWTNKRAKSTVRAWCGASINAWFGTQWLRIKSSRCYQIT